jgi:hypothetical protein
MSNESQAREDLVRHLLGPEEPELDCDECFEQLDRFVELEVAGRGAGEAIPGMRAHFEGCPACREDYESLRALVESQA